MKFSNFSEVSAESNRRRQAKDLVGALDLIASEETHFAPQAGLARIWRIELLAQLGRVDEAIELLADALDRGYRYRGRWLRDPRFASIAADPRFDKLVELADAQ